MSANHSFNRAGNKNECKYKQVAGAGFEGPLWSAEKVIKLAGAGFEGPIWSAKKLENLLKKSDKICRQTENSKTEATLLLCGSSGERANK